MILRLGEDHPKPQTLVIKGLQLQLLRQRLIGLYITTSII